MDKTFTVSLLHYIIYRRKDLKDEEGDDAREVPE